MIQITVSNLNKYFGERLILKNICFDLHDGQCASLVGPNGCGKTTLLRILASLDGDYQGDISMARNLRVGLLQQIPDYGEQTVRQVLEQGFSYVKALETDMRALEMRMSEGDTDELHKYAEFQQLYEAHGGYEQEVAYGRTANGLNIPPEMQQRPFSSLSGGEKTRVCLAQIMLSGVDVLLLDEPTNHLDIESIEWLEGYLSSFRGCALIVSHDRYFLDRVTSKTIELFDCEATVYPGNYSYYADKKAAQMEQLEADKARQDREIARLEHTFTRMHGWGLGNSKLMKRAFSVKKRIDRIDRIRTIRRERKMKNKFAETARSGDEVFYIENLSAGYEIPLISSLSCGILRGERVAILGPNGCGKTTLLRTLLRDLPPLSGVFYEGTGVKIGLLPQEVSFARPDRTLLETMLYEAGHGTQQSRDRLGAFGFRGEDVFKTVRTLSGGEKTRLQLCLFMNLGVNTLFLDEPTNHLDILSREWIEDAIDDFSETMIFVSHDRYFIDRFATRVLSVENGQVYDFTGTYAEFKEDTLRRAQLMQARDRRQPKPAPEKPAGYKSQRPKNPERQKLQLERQAEVLERALAQLDQETDKAADDYIKLSEILSEKQVKEERLMALYEQIEEITALSGDMIPSDKQ